MRTRTAAAAAISAALLATLTACGNSEPADPGLTAQTMVDQLNDLFPLPNPRDNTGSCNDGKGHKNSCEQLITTDPVSVYELGSKMSAEDWTSKMSKASTDDVVQAGRFMLIWHEDYPSDQDAVDTMTARAKELAAAEK